jgi:hypothetical protein
VSGVVLKSMHVSAGIFQLEFDCGLTDAAAHPSRSHFRTWRLQYALRPRRR